MRCLIKIPRRYLICLSLSVVFSFCLSVFGFVSDSYATSSTCTWNVSKTGSSDARLVNFFTHCGITNDTPYYIRVISLSLSYSGTYSSSMYFNLYWGGSSSNYPRLFVWNPTSSSTSFSVSTSNIVTNFWNLNDTIFYLAYPDVVFDTSSSTYYEGSVVFEYTTDVSDFGSGGDSEPCPEVTPCPPIPENPYDNKLDDIKKAIYTASAVMIMIYFFFIVYKIIVKDGGRR